MFPFTSLPDELLVMVLVKLDIKEVMAVSSVSPPPCSEGRNVFPCRSWYMT